MLTGRRARRHIGTFAAGRIELRPYVWQLRLARPLTKPIEIEVVSVDPIDRRSEFGELWSLDYGTRVMTLETPTATLLWAVSPIHAEWALARIT